MCLVTTLAGAVNGGVDEDIDSDIEEFGTNGKLLTEYLKDQDFAVYWDEAHFGGSSSKFAVAWNVGYGIQENYKASYYRFAEGLAHFGKVTGFTATPLFEHRGLLPNHIQSDMYHFLTSKDDWATVSELTEITSQTRFIKSYNPDKVGFRVGLSLALLDFLAFSEKLKLLSEQIMSFEPKLKLTPKIVMLLNAGAAIPDPKTSLPLTEQVEEVETYLTGKVDPDAHIFGKATENGYMTKSLNSKWTKVRSFREFVNKMLDPNDPLQFVFHLEKFKFGLNIANVTHEVHSRERNQQGETKVTVSILQIWGRAVRTFFGIDKSMFVENKVPNYVSDAIEWLLSNYSKSEVFEELKEYMMLCNSHTFFVPETDTYAVAIPQWNDSSLPYAAPLERSQFHIDSRGESLISSVSGMERDLAYKIYKEKVPYCEQHKDNSCKDENRNLEKYEELSNEQFEDAWWKALHVNHINGNREDMKEENLESVCPNYHGVETMLEEHYMNNYGAK